MNNKKDERYRLGAPIIRFSNGGTSISNLVRHNGYNESDYKPWAARMLGRFPIPKWQRELCWTDEQDRAFVQSVFEGFDLGSVMINDWEEDDNGLLRPMSDILIDGQQRTNAVIRFTRNEFDYLGYYWNDLNRTEQRRFLEAEIGLKKVRCYNEAKLKQAYNHLNFTGVRHAESERA